MCEANYRDEFNPGCNSATPAFTPITPGVTVCGTSGIFPVDGEQTPDFDWYEVVLDEFDTITWSVRAEFRAQIWILDGNMGCPGEILTTAQAFECDEVTVTANVPAGRYWLVVAPFSFTDSSACGTRYTASVSVLDKCGADLDGDDAVGPSDLAILLGAWGPNPGSPADLSGDGVVGAADLALLLAGWGDCLQ